jgi:tryptophan 2,3-dioxygenase
MSCPFGFGRSDLGATAEDRATDRIGEDAAISYLQRLSAPKLSRESSSLAPLMTAAGPIPHQLEQDYFPGIGSICLEQSRRRLESDRPSRVLPEPPLRPEELNQGYWRDAEDEELCMEGDEPEGTPDPSSAPDAVATQEVIADAEITATVRDDATRTTNALTTLTHIADAPACDWNGFATSAERLQLSQRRGRVDADASAAYRSECGRNPQERLGLVSAAQQYGIDSSYRRDGVHKTDALDCSSITESDHSFATDRAWQGGLCGDHEPRAATEYHPDPRMNELPLESRPRWNARRLMRVTNWRRDMVDASWPPRHGVNTGLNAQLGDSNEKADDRALEPKISQSSCPQHTSMSGHPHMHVASSPVPNMELPAEQRGTAYIRQRKGRPLYYSSYLKLDRLLSCQEPISWLFGDHAHDEMLFITIHQVYELWFKQLIHELDSLRLLFLQDIVTSKQSAPGWQASTDPNRMMNLALHRLDRMVEIQRLLVEQIRVLETMTPQEFLTFRDYLFPASGFQSWQYRLLEVKLGVRAEQRVSNHWKMHLSEQHQAILSKAEQEPSLFDLINQWLERLPFVVTAEADFNFWDEYQRATERMLALDRAFIDREIHAGADRARAYRELSRMRNLFRSVYVEEVHQEMVERGQRRMSFKAMAAALLIMLYERGAPYLQLPHRVLRRLLDLDEGMAQWRFRHVQLVSRMIGSKTGTGGSLGVHYLMLTLESSRVFTDLGNMAALLIPERLLPALPGKLRHQLEYAWTQG